MSLLNKLKKQAQDVREKEMEDEDITITSADEEIHKQNAVVLNRKLDFIHHYLIQLAENLNIIKPDNDITYNLIDPKQDRFNIPRVKKTHFTVHETKSENGNRVILKYDLYSKAGLSIKLKNDAKLPTVRKLLTERTIHYFETDAEGDRVVITLANPVSTRFIYSADIDNCMIVLKLDNFDGPWSHLMMYMPEDITEELMDETAKYILGDENRFSQLSAEEGSTY
jgi:hypothetical protein